MIAQLASEMVLQPIEWLWPGYLAFGNLTMLDGDPGLGKSMITLDLGSRLTTGRAWPDGSPGPQPAPVYILRTEDPDSIILPRLRSLGADMGRVFVWPWSEDLPSLPSEVARIEAELIATRARLLIIDPLMAFLDSNIVSASDGAVRRALRSLAVMAQVRGCAILLVRHLNKKPGQNALYRGGGSIAFVSACRLAWLAGRDPKASDRYVLAQQKNNCAPRQSSLSYTLPRDAPRVDWQGPTTWSADDLSGPRRRRPALERARQFLRAFLEAGPRLSQDVIQAGKDEGLSKRTLERAKDEMEIRSQLVAGKGSEASYWLLHDQLLPPGVAICPDVDRYFHELRKARAEL